MRILFVLGLLIFAFNANAQDGYWQQSANYKMDILVDVNKHQFDGNQKIVYTNNSPDQLDRLFYHLYYNAFQPNSMMDVRSRTISDPDKRVGDRIAALKPDEIGYQRVNWLKVRGEEVAFHEEGTILEVTLEDPILPGETVLLECNFSAQIPLQVRRTGRDSNEGISLSMTQWYPKLSEYDEQGWHANPYVGREFHGVWGDFDVTINIDSKYILGATGELQNPDEIGYGYGEEPKKKGKLLSWNFIGKNIHDFAWAADPDFKHDTHVAHDGTVFHFLYEPTEEIRVNWEKLPSVMDEALKFINKNYGKYPYPVYSFIQGGDGGMEYPMATLITGKRSMSSLVGVAIHELMHSWYQLILATDEAQYPWMDEGFTSYASLQTTNYLKEKNMLAGTPVDNPMASRIKGFNGWIESGLDEPLTTHADHYDTNAAYGVASYNKGAIYLEQLKYIVGEEAFAKGLLAYYDEWKYKHPNDERFIRVIEKVSGMELDWYNEYWIGTTKYPDYGIDSVYADKIVLKKTGQMPMPLEVLVTKLDGTEMVYYIPITLMRADKPNEWDRSIKYKQLPDWPWTHPEYTIDMDTKGINSIIINPQNNFVDKNRSDNSWPDNTMIE